jgi:hypothetical protein
LLIFTKRLTSQTPYIEGLLNNSVTDDRKFQVVSLGSARNY